MKKTADIRNPNACRQRGIGLMTALITAAFVGIMILVSGYLFATQMRRTRDLPHANQDRQLLLAATDTLLARLNASPKAEPLAAFDLPIPAKLANAKVTCQPDPASENSYKITATIGDSRAQQIVTVKKEKNRYTLSSAKLFPQFPK